jgi:hypothetical protein
MKDDEAPGFAVLIREAHEGGLVCNCDLHECVPTSARVKTHKFNPPRSFSLERKKCEEPLIIRGMRYKGYINISAIPGISLPSFFLGEFLLNILDIFRIRVIISVHVIRGIFIDRTESRLLYGTKKWLFLPAPRIPSMPFDVVMKDIMPIRINCHDKNRTSSQPADISWIMIDPILVSQASYTALTAVFGFLYGPI